LKIQQKETRSQTVFRHTRAMLHATSDTTEKLALRLMEAHPTMVPPGGYQFKDTGNLIADVTANTRRIERWLSEDAAASNGRMPIDVEETWLACMLEPYKTDCFRDLHIRVGTMPVLIPKSGAIHDHKSIADLMRETGEAVQAVGEMMETGGGIGPEDRHLAGNTKKQLIDVIAAAHGLIERINEGTK